LQLLKEIHIEKILIDAVKANDQLALFGFSSFKRSSNKRKLDPSLVWVLQTIICETKPFASDSWSYLLNQANNPETSLYIHCALTFIYGSVFDDAVKSMNAYQHATSIDPNIFNRYLAFGKQINLCKDEHVALVECLESQPQSTLRNRH
jgi:hypothetical protein